MRQNSNNASLAKKWMSRLRSIVFPTYDDSYYPRPYWFRWIRRFFLFFWIVPSFLLIAFLNNYYISVVISQLTVLLTQGGFQSLLNLSNILHVLQFDQLIPLLKHNPSPVFLLLAILLFSLIGYWARQDQSRERVFQDRKEKDEKDKKRQEEQHRISEKIVEEVHKIHHVLEPRLLPLFDEAANREMYLKELRKQYGFVTLPIGSTMEFSLQAIFQPLKLRRDPFVAKDFIFVQRQAQVGKLAENSQQMLQNTDQSSPPIVIAENCDEALSKSPQGRMVILGSPGTGKTTVLQSLVANLARKAIIDLTIPLPIFVSLPDLVRSGAALQEYLLRLVKTLRLGDQGVYVLRNAIERGGAFVCLDSLDEVIPNQRPAIIKMINELASDPGNTWVVGSRFTEYKGGQFKRGQFTEWELQPMNHELRVQLAQRLLPEVHALLQDTVEIDEHESLSFVKLLEGHPKAAAWGENPLLFSIAAVVFVRTGALPLSRTMLYQQIIDSILEIREPDPIRRRILYRVLADLALELYKTKGRSFTHDDLLTLLPAVRTRQQENWLTEEMVNRIISSSVLEVVAHQTYVFKHQTFQEYLAAAELTQRLTNRYQAIREETWNFVWSKRTYSRWTEILRLLVGILVQMDSKEGVQAAQRWLHRLIEQRTTLEGDPGYLGLDLAIKSLTEMTETNETNIEEGIVEAWIAELLDTTGYRFRVRTWEHGQSDTVLLDTKKRKRLRSLASDLGNLNSDIVKRVVNRLLSAFEDGDSNICVEVARTLGGVKDSVPVESLLTALNTKYSDLRSGDVRRTVIESLGEYAPVNYLIDALNDKDILVCWSAKEKLDTLADRVPVSLLHDTLQNGSEFACSTATYLLYKLGVSVSVKPLLTYLTDSRWQVRSGAIEALGELDLSAPIDPLIATLGDESWAVRRAVAHALGKLGERVPIKPLVDTMYHSRWEVRSTATEALGNLGVRAPISPFLEALNDEDGRVRIEAAIALSKMGERAPAEPLIAALQDGNDYVRKQAAIALGTVCQHAPMERILEALDDTSVDVRKAVAESIGKIEPREEVERLLLGFTDRCWFTRTGALQILGKVEAHASVVTLLETALREAPGSIRSIAVRVAGDLGAATPIELLMTALYDKHSEVLSAWLNVIEKHRDLVPVEPLVVALQDKSYLIRRTAAQALGKIGTRTPIEPLVAALDDNDWRVRRVVALALGELGESSLFESLVSALHDSMREVREAAAQALGKLGERTPIEPLVAALNDNNWRVRRAAVQSLRKLGDHVPLEVFEPVLLDDAEDVQRAAVRTVGKLKAHMSTESLVVALLDENENVRCTSVWALAERGDQAPVEALVIALSDKAESVREAAASALEKVGDRVPVASLLIALNDNSWRVRQIVVRILGTLKVLDIAEKMACALRDNVVFVRLEAVKALGKLGDNAPIERLIDVLDDEEPQVRAAALSTLGKQGKRVPVELFTLALGDSEEDVREAAAQVLQHEHPDTLLSLIPEATAILQGREPGAVFGSLKQGLIAETIGNMGAASPTLIETLTRLLDWPYWEVRMKAAYALGKVRRNIPDDTIRHLLKLRHDSQSKKVCEAADEALAEILSLESGIEED